MFKEITLPTPIAFDIDPMAIQNKMVYSVKVKYRASVNSYAFEDRASIEQVLGKFLKFNIPPHYIGYLEFDLDPGDLYPHTDAHRFALNIILEDQSAVTKFWTTTEKPETSWDGSHNYNIYSCKPIGEFKAKSGSAWLYDLHVIHSVHGTIGNKRRMITARWTNSDITFDQLYNSIEVL